MLFSPNVHKILFTEYGRTALILTLVILTASYQDQFGISGRLTGDREKFPEFLRKKNYLNYFYKFETLVPFSKCHPCGRMQRSHRHSCRWKYRPKCSTEILSKGRFLTATVLQLFYGLIFPQFSNTYKELCINILFVRK